MPEREVEMITLPQKDLLEKLIKEGKIPDQGIDNLIKKEAGLLIKKALGKKQ